MSCYHDVARPCPKKCGCGCDRCEGRRRAVIERALRTEDHLRREAFSILQQFIKDGNDCTFCAMQEVDVGKKKTVWIHEDWCVLGQFIFVRKERRNAEARLRRFALKTWGQP